VPAAKVGHNRCGDPARLSRLTARGLTHFASWADDTREHGYRGVVVSNPRAAHLQSTWEFTSNSSHCRGIEQRIMDGWGWCRAAGLRGAGFERPSGLRVVAIILIVPVVNR